MLCYSLVSIVVYIIYSNIYNYFIPSDPRSTGRATSASRSGTRSSSITIMLMLIMIMLITTVIMIILLIVNTIMCIYREREREIHT